MGILIAGGVGTFFIIVLIIVCLLMKHRRRNRYETYHNVLKPKKLCVFSVTQPTLIFCLHPKGSSGGRVVKLLACEAKGTGFDIRPRHLNFQRLVISSASKSRYG